MEAVVDRLLVLGVLNLYDFFRFAVNFTYAEAYGAVLATIPEIVVPMMARSVNVGHTPGVLEGDAFLYRCQMVLVGLHQDWIRGISLGMDGYDEVETCCVAIFPLHDFLVNENSFIYGGEGGFLREAHMLHMRVLADQDWQSPGNFALLRSMDCATAVRLVVSSQIWLNDDEFYYLYVGLFMVFDWRVLISDNGFTVFEFFLERIVE
ncbi:histone-lysine N-methyltransferase H3 lysine-9 specific SUVH6-like protein [Trifolium pratense]|uniref:Histone-lysine N-methyltransferase H3 lysine-9 specific SUVH6-like protein n=1 Tax=Trifolium pratense TaxID=57577 RepID=A0A2K3KJT4_TRIPR|nr:histone-lysine N-methyltransferase H3 lysine-9 specific SUVH6-like protein [Trifolium pratense]